jgi:uncharacterized protein YyaL (SSP411 family)
VNHRFSPRANRAAEIGWLEWSPDAFERAKATDRPILLGISAVWCHWCHVMDETTYSDPRVIDLIREHYVPVRVDNDRRPDVNTRYNMGGWPTTAFLAPTGEILMGATYVPPDEFAQMLQQVAEAWKQERAELQRRLSERRPAMKAPQGTRGDNLHPDTVDAIARTIVAGYDETYGGFGSAPKFPQTDALNFLLLLYRRERAEGKTAERLYEILARTALAMARGGMYDRVEGGFFRYSTTRDWSVPHFEKMAEDHAGLVRFYADLYRASGNEQFRETLRSALGWLRGVLRNPGSALFGGSQDADERYFSLELDERRKIDAPYVDRTVYTNWNADLAAALTAASLALDDDTLLADARATLEGLFAQMLDPRSQLAFHFKPPDGAPEHGPLLTDQAALVAAALDVHAATGEAAFLERARAIAEAAIECLRDESGAFADSGAGDLLGNLATPHHPLDDNAKMADSLLRLAAVLAEERYARIGREILLALDADWRQAGPFAAPYGEAMLRALGDPLTVAIVGDVRASEVLRDAALRLPNPLAVVYTLPADEKTLAARGYLAGNEPLAYICEGTRCAAPARDAATLQESYDALRQLPVR